MSDKQVEEIVKEYADLAKDKNIDVSALMMNALAQQDQNRLNPKHRRWAYLVSLLFPPVGFLLAVYFYFKSETDAKVTAYWCVGLTTFSIVLSILFFYVILSSSGVSVELIRQIDPNEIYELTQ